MAAPRQTTWELEPHTRAKHAILQRYLQAWMAILSQGRFPELLYVDGFAGPGEYVGGEVGSPLIALRTALNYDPPLRAKIHFLFVDKDPNRAAHLRGLVDDIRLPNNFSVMIEATTFEQAFSRHFHRFLRNGRLIPTFAFIDPFGWAGAPFQIVQKILRHKSCEVFINFMYEEINRFIGHQDQGKNFDGFFGTRAWEECDRMVDPRERNRCLHDLYRRQLEEAAGAKFVRSFEMSNFRDVTDYYLFYATGELLGLKRMKEAMWKADESGEFRFSDATDENQLVLFEKEPNFSRLKEQILRKFSGQEVSVGEIERFVLVETAYRETHFKRILKSLELDTHQLTVIQALPKRKAGTFGDANMVLRFE